MNWTDTIALIALLTFLFQIIKLFTNQTPIIMSQLEELQSSVSNLTASVQTLQEKVDQEQAQIAALLETNTATVAALEAQIQVLNDQLANGISAEQIQAAINSLNDTKLMIDAASADVASTVDPVE